MLEVERVPGVGAHLYVILGHRHYQTMLPDECPLQGQLSVHGYCQYHFLEETLPLQVDSLVLGFCGVAVLLQNEPLGLACDFHPIF